MRQAHRISALPNIITKTTRKVQFRLSTFQMDPQGNQASIDYMSTVNNYNPFHFQGSINGSKIIVLLDTGATGNVIGRELAQRLKLPIQDCSRVKVGYAEEGRTEFITKTVTVSIWIQEYHNRIQFYVANIGEELILGVPFLESIRVTDLFWRDRSFSFYELKSRQKHCWIGQEVRCTKNRIQMVSLQRLKDCGWDWSAEIRITRITEAPEATSVKVEDEPRILVGDAEASENGTRSASHRWYSFHSISKSKMGLENEDNHSTSVDQELATISQSQPAMEGLLSKYRDRFAEPKGLPISRPEDMTLDLIPGTRVPTWRNVQKLNESELEILKDKIAELLSKGFIVPSTSPYGSSVLFVKKGDGSLRLCVDYRALNDLTVKNRCPLPNVIEMRDRLGGSKVFSKIDLRDGYHNILVSEQDRHKTAFRCRYGHFQYTVVPFGLANAPAVFCSMMNRIFGQYLDVFLICYLDDIVVYSTTVDEHLVHLGKVFELLETHKLFLKPSKCSFFQDSVTFCGHDITATGIRIAQDKIQAMTARPELHNAKDVKSWLGVCVWFHDFIEDYASIAAPLIELTVKTKTWQWEDKHELAVSLLIQAITSAPVLRYFDSKLPTEVFTDASAFGIGGWLRQEHPDGWHPVVFWSRKLRPAEFNYTVHDLELLGLVAFLSKQTHLLRGVRFTAHTDHKSLVYLNSQPNLNGRQARWVIFLSDFDFSIKYFPGPKNNVADFLSRNVLVQPKCVNCQAPIQLAETGLEVKSWGIETDTVVESFVSRVRDGLATDSWAIAVRTSGPTDPSQGMLVKQYVVRNHLLWHQDRMYIPEGALRTELLARYHDNVFSGHQGRTRTKEKMGRRYYWPGMDNDVAAYIRSCHECQKSRISTQKETGFLHPLPIPSDRFRDVGIDWCFLERSINQGFDSIMIVICRLTKFTVFIPCRKTDGAKETARDFIRYWYCRGMGLPCRITSDRDSRFRAQLWRTLISNLGITHQMTTARHQQANGQAENIIKTLKQGLKKVVNYAQNDWMDKLPAIEFALNNSISSTTGFTPFYLAFGYVPREVPGDWDVEETGQTRDLIREISNNLSVAREAAFEAQDVQAMAYDRRHRRPGVLLAGDLVLVHSDGLRSETQNQRPGSLLPSWMGPFKILSLESSVNYRLELPASMHRVHPVFHTSKIRKYWPPLNDFPLRPAPLRPDPTVSEQGLDVFEIDRILDKKIRKNSSNIKYLVKWVGYPDEEAEWCDFLPGRTDADWAEDMDKVVEFEASLLQSRRSVKKRKS